ncbi:MAG: thioredoxin family protein [Bacteriovoracaceae bacterium]|nr:thioredoxin family protein [Bacteriovoracaceae bacterium]
MKIFAFLLLFVSFLSFAQEREDHAVLGSDVLSGTQKLLALTIKHEEKWHTYWKNPGDAGIATQFKFELDGVEQKFVQLEWPTPNRYIEAGDILTYGYQGDPTYFFKIPLNLVGNLKVKVQWLICKDICLPGGQDAELLFEKNDQVVVKSRRSGFGDDELQKRLKALPQVSSWPKNLELYVSKDGEKTLRIDYTVSNYPKESYNKDKNLLTPFLAPPLTFKREEIRFNPNENSLHGKLTVDWDGEYQEPSYPLPSNGKFSPEVNVKFIYQDKDGKSLIIEKSISSFSTTSTGLEDHFKSQQSLTAGTTESVAPSQEPDEAGLLFMLLFAFAGGLILNLMPCVLPVISLKLFGMIKYQSLPHKRVIQHNLVYSAGVISTFLMLATSIVIVKSSGEAVGWGFQLQSPLFVLAMIGLLFVLSLNLFGLFEFTTPGGKSIGNAQIKDGFTGDFFSGVLSTILSTPCSAPFLGTALTFAFTNSNAMIFLIFAFIGLGLSFPFLLTAIFPTLISFIPKPGAWMEKLKYFLGLSMLVTVAWLSDVFLNLVDPALWMWPLALFFISLFFAFFFRAKISKNTGLALLFFLLPFALVLGAIKNFPLKPADRTITNDIENLWQPWSPEMLETHKGKWVFFDFTAAWCLTCKVNKKLVLDTQEFKNFAVDNDIVLLRGDWTQRDDTITNFLKGFRIFGVPAYFIQKPDGTIISLGETISIGKIKDHLKP